MAPPSPRARQLWRAIVLSVAYVAVYLVLDRISFIEPLHGIGITPWNPSTGVMLALLIINGVRWSPVVLVAELISGATLPQIPVLPGQLFVAAIVVTVGYAGAAAILRHLRFEASLRRTSDVVVLLLAASISSCLVGSGFVATYAAAGVVPWTGFADAMFQYWIGDAIGIVVFTPPLLMITQSSALPAPADRGRHWLQLLEVPAQGASIVGFLEAQRARMRKDLRLYTGGEDNFCHRLSRNSDGTFNDFGMLDRHRLMALDMEPVLSEVPVVIEGHAFTTGAVPRTGIEHVLPNSWVEVGIKDGLGCDAHAYMNHHFSEDELAGRPQPDQHWHEHATCFRLGDRGLVVISSCGHAGIINTLRRAPEVADVEKIYALVGGFHLAPAPEEYLRQVMAELKKFDLDHVLPMHCSGQNFIDLAKQEMPEKLVLCTTGSRFTFTA